MILGGFVGVDELGLRVGAVQLLVAAQLAERLGPLHLAEDLLGVGVQVLDALANTVHRALAERWLTGPT